MLIKKGKNGLAAASVQRCFFWYKVIKKIFLETKAL